MHATEIQDSPLIGRTLAERFRVDACREQQGQVLALEGTDLALGVDVAMLAVPLRLISPATRGRLEQELLVLRELDQHPRLVAMSALVEAEGRLVAVRRRAPGVTLRERLGAGPLGLPEALSIAADVLQGLSAMHERGVLHLDVEPGVVTLAGEPDRAVLTHLGFSRSIRLLGAGSLAVETAHYCSPEEAGVIHRRLDERSDLYSLGCLLYGALCGRPPFGGATVGDALRAQVAGTPRPPSAGRDDVPPAVDRLLERLLATDPSERYPVAQAALADVRRVQEALQRGDGRRLSAQALPAAGALAQPELIGRDRELAALLAAADRAREGQGQLVVLEADSGGGKSRLLEELAQRCAGRAWVLRGEGRDGGAQTPYRVLEGVIAAVAARAGEDRELSQRLRSRLGEQVGDLAGVMPQLAPVLGPAPSHTHPEAARRPQRTQEALRLMLNSLGSDSDPALVLLDDCQWADESTVELLRDWQRRAEPRHVTIVAAVRSEEGERVAPLLEAAALRLKLAALQGEEIARLVESMAGPVPAAVAHVVDQMSAGSPFMAAEVLRGLVETEALHGAEDGWRLAEAELDRIRPSDRAAALIGERIGQLPQRLLELLAAGALLGKQFAPEAAAALVDMPLAEAVELLGQAARRHIVWFDGASGRWAFLHDRLREVLRARLSEESQRALHARIAGELERSAPDEVFELAYHFDAAGRPEAALPYALAAAREAHRRHALQIAEHHYRIAQRGSTAADGPTRRAICEGLGDLALLRGRYEEADEWFVEALRSCDDRSSCAEIEGKLGELAFKLGDIETATTRLERALRLLGERIPHRRLGFVLRLARELLVQIAHTLLPGSLVARRALGGSERDRLAARLYSELAHAYWFGSGLAPCGWAHLRGLNLAERYPPTPELAQAYSEHAPVATMLPAFERGMAYARRSLEIRRGFGDLWGEGQSLHFYGVALYSASRYAEALEKCREAVSILERTGDQWEISTAKWHIAACLYRLGRLDEAAEVAREIHFRAAELGDLQAAGISLGFWAKATGGDVPEPLVRQALASESGDVHTSAEVLQAAALRHLAAGEAEQAVQALERADALVSRAGLRQEYVAPVSVWLVSALRRLAEQTPSVAPRRRRKLVRQARRASRRACRLARRYPNNLPHALRERALLAAAAGRPGRARRLLDRSLEVAERQGAAHEYALTLKARGEVGVAVGWREGAEELERAQRLLHAMTPHGAREPRQATLSLADRFSTVLEAGRAIASALSREAAHAAVHDAAVALLRVPSCTVYAVAAGRGGELEPVAGDRERSGRMRFVRQALAAERTVMTFGLEGDSRRSPGSVLCATIRVRGVPAACLCAVHPEVQDLFGAEEEQLAEYIAALAGAALENAQGFAESEALSRSLEVRVQDRTAELAASQAQMASTLSLLEATLDSTADGILVVGDGTIRSYNRKFAEMWKVPGEVLESGDVNRAINYVLDQLLEPARFLSRLEELDAEPMRESQDVLEFKDGRVYERISKPQLVGGASVGRVWSFRDITAQKRSERELEHLANHDGLTGLLNRRCFEQELGRTIAHVSRYGGAAALLLLDIDNFKYVNDTLGHGAGDELIKSIARLLARRLRASDLVARLGGDEFAVLLRESEAEAANAVAVDLLTEIRHHTMSVGGQRVSMTVSIGVTLLDSSASDPSQLLADADLAMYEAKRDGRDGVSIYSPARAREARLRARFSWAEQLRSALEEDRFELFAQPILDVGSGEVRGHEILLRMPGEDGALLTPGAFMPTAERLGLVLAIDRWVVSRAVRAIGGRPGEGLLSINLSGASIGDPELPALIAHEVEAAAIDPGRLIFEVTETATIANMDQARRFADALTALGCRFALDDFGTGFGSFYYLKHLPVDYLKIDGDFISDLPESSTDQHVVRAIVQIAQGTGKHTVAECVTDAAVLRWVRELGVDLAQGHYLGRPRPLGEVLGRTAARR